MCRSIKPLYSHLARRKSEVVFGTYVALHSTMGQIGGHKLYIDAFLRDVYTCVIIAWCMLTSIPRILVSLSISDSLLFVPASFIKISSTRRNAGKFSLLPWTQSSQALSGFSMVQRSPVQRAPMPITPRYAPPHTYKARRPCCLADLLQAQSHIFHCLRTNSS